MLHTAAQGDQAYSLTYFKHKGISIDSVDNQNATPLHWACYSASDTAIYYLQSWGCKVNEQDSSMNTPLHIAVSNGEHFYQLRAIKELLIKGASRDMTDSQGRRPLDLVASIKEQ